MKLNRRDDLWLFTNYGKVCVLNFFRLMGVNKTFNLDEEYFMRERAGEISSFLRPSEFFTSAIVMKEKPTADFLLIVTKNGKIKYFRLTSLFNKIGRSGRQLLTLKRDVIRCNEHQEKLDSHVTESISHVCGFSCEISRSFNREIAKCLNCRIVFREDNDEIFRSVLVKDDDIVEVVVKSKLVSGNIKNQKISLQRLVRIRIEIFLGENKIVVPKYCLKHQDLAVEHLIKHKRDGVSCSLTCSFLKEFGKEIKVCSLCQSPQLFTKV